MNPGPLPCEGSALPAELPAPSNSFVNEVKKVMSFLVLCDLSSLAEYVLEAIYLVFVSGIQ